MDVGFTTRQAVHIFAILEELLDGLFKHHGILEHLDVLLDNGPSPSRSEVHLKRRVGVLIDKLVLRLLPSAVHQALQFFFPSTVVMRNRSFCSVGKGYTAFFPSGCSESANLLQLDFR